MSVEYSSKEVTHSFVVLLIISLIGTIIFFLMHRNIYSYDSYIKDVVFTMCFYGAYEIFSIALLKKYKIKYKLKNLNIIFSIISSVVFIIIAGITIYDYFIGFCIGYIICFYYVPFNIIICFIYTLDKLLKLKGR